MFRYKTVFIDGKIDERKKLKTTQPDYTPIVWNKQNIFCSAGYKPYWQLIKKLLCKLVTDGNVNTTEMSLKMPKAMHEKISEIVRKTRLFTDHEDFIMHAITDVLEKHGGE